MPSQAAAGTVEKGPAAAGIHVCPAPRNYSLQASVTRKAQHKQMNRQETCMVAKSSDEAAATRGGSDCRPEGLDIFNMCRVDLGQEL